MKLHIDLMKDYVSERAISEAKACWDFLTSSTTPYADSIGWIDCDQAIQGSLTTIMEKAKEIRENADIFVVVGVGGSNQAARAVIDAILPQKIEIVWLGNTLSAAEIASTMQKLDGKSIYVNVIAKNFETLEPGSHYRLLRSYMRRLYTPEQMADRIVITGTEGSRLHEIAKENGHLFLPFPKRIGGRYTAFTPVALFPIAVAGLDIHAYLEGGRQVQKDFLSGSNPDVLSFASWRNECLRRNYHIEMLSAFEPSLERFSRWWKQLFGESEGKDYKGIFPASMIGSEDLHSMGQYMQEGPRHLLETFIHVNDAQATIKIEPDSDFHDGFDYLDGKNFADINLAAEQATIEAHQLGGVPCAIIDIEQINERAFGELFYFFMAVCAVSGCILNVNPFDQNGVEAYKISMFKKLEK